MKKYLFLLSIMLALFFVSACTATSPEPDAAINESVTAVPTRIVVPTKTAVAEPTLIPTTIMASPTPTATPNEEIPPTVVPTEAPVSGIPFEPAGNWQMSAQYGGMMQTIDVDDATAYIGAGLHLLLVDISNPRQPTLLHRSEQLPDVVHEIAVDGNWIYLANGNGGLAIMNASDPTAPQIVNQIDRVQDNLINAHHIAIDEGRLYVTTNNAANSASHFYVFDLAVPENPTLVHSEEFAANTQIIVDNGRFYLMSPNEIQSRQTAEPGVVLSSHSYRADYQYPTMLVVDNVGYFAPNYYQQLHRLDLSDDNAITPLENGPNISSSRQMALIGDILLVNSLFGEFGYCSSMITAVNVSDLTILQPEQPWSLSQCIVDMKSNNELLYAVGRRGFTIYDLDSVQNNTPLATFTHPDGFLDVQTVTMDRNGLLQLSSGESGQTKFLTFNPTEATAGAPISIEAGSINNVHSIENAWLAPTWGDGLRIVDAINASTPTLAVNWTYETLPSTDFLTSAVWNHYLYLPVYAGELGQIAIIDVSDPLNPEWVDTFKAKNSQVMGMVAANGRLVVFSQETTQDLELFDLADPLKPTRVSTLALDASFTQFAVVGDTLYAACAWGNCRQLLIIDISDPANIQIQEMLPLATEIIKMEVVAEDTLHLLTVEDGVWIMDITNPTQPVITSKIPLPSTPADLTSGDGKIFVANGDLGLIELSLMP